jgi:transcriptional regulator with XRE-family HTH domain
MEMPISDTDNGASAFGRRLRESAIKHGITGPQELSERIQKAGFGLQISSVKRHWYGRDVPTGRNLLAYSEVIGVSADYLLAGKEPPLPSIDELMETIRKVAAQERQPLPVLGDRERELLALVMKLNNPDNIKILINMARSMLLTEQESEKE